MKPFYLFTVLVVTSTWASAQIELGPSYSISLPLHEMKQNIKPVHSLNFIFLSTIKGFNKLSWGIEAGFGQYASFTRDQDIRMPDGSGGIAQVTYSSNVASAGIMTRFNFLKESKLNPYVAGKLGYASFFSTVTVADPGEDEDCKPLDEKTPISDHSFFASYGAGLQIDISSKKKPKNVWIDISVNQLYGTKLDYINIKDIKDHVHTDPDNPASPSDKSVPLNVTFVNVSTQAIHEHQLAEVYNSSLRLLEMKIGVVWRIRCD